MWAVLLSFTTFGEGGKMIIDFLWCITDFSIGGPQMLCSKQSTGSCIVQDIAVHYASVQVLQSLQYI